MAESVDAPDLKSVGHYARGSSSLPTRILLNITLTGNHNIMAQFRYTISRKHVFVDNVPVLMYYVESMPFAFDVLEDEQKNDKWILAEAALNEEYTMEDIFKYSDYLIAEECHPVLFDLDLVNPEVMPDEHVS